MYITVTHLASSHGMQELWLFRLWPANTLQ